MLTRSQSVIGGNGRMTAMKEMGWDAADCVVLDVDDTVVLDVRVLSDLDPVDVAADHGVHPDARVIAQLDVADHQVIMLAHAVPPPLVGGPARRLGDLPPSQPQHTLADPRNPAS